LPKKSISSHVAGKVAMRKKRTPKMTAWIMWDPLFG
jgi:hypothetical protein